MARSGLLHAEEAKPVELEVEPGGDLRGGQVDRVGHGLGGAARGREGAETVGLFAEIDVTVLDAEEHVVGDRIFNAGADIEADMQLVRIREGERGRAAGAAISARAQAGRPRRAREAATRPSPVGW